MFFVRCEVHPGVGAVDASVAVRDTRDVRTFLQVDRNLLTERRGQAYLPVGLVHQDKERGVALIEFPVEADSGAHRLWVPAGSLLDANGVPA